MNCLFCKIISGEIPSSKVYEDEHCFAFRDIAPKAPVHVLIIPKEHIASADCIDSTNSAVIAKLLEAVPKVAKLCGVTGYRLVSNIGPDAGQTVFHLHFHLLGGEKLSESLA